MYKKQQEIYDFAELMYHNYIITKKSIDNINQNSQLINNINYLSDDFKEGFISAIRTLSSYIFFL